MRKAGKGFFMLALAVLLAVRAAAAGPSLVFFTQDFPPFSSLEAGKPAGPGVDIIRRVCGAMRVDCSFEVLPWNRALTEARRGRANGLFFLGKSPDREAWLDFSRPLVDTEYGVFVRKASPLRFRQPEDLEKLVVGVYGPSNTSASLDAATRGLDLRIDMTPDDVSAFRKLDIGRIDAVYSNRAAGLALIRERNLANVRYAGSHKSLQYYIALTKATDPALSRAFFAVLDELERKGEIRKILAKYGLG